MNRSSKRMIKAIASALWFVLDMVLYLADTFDGFGNYSALFAIILWVLVWLALLWGLERLLQDW